MHLSWPTAAPLKTQGGTFLASPGQTRSQTSRLVGKTFHKGGGVLLCRSVLSAMVIYHLVVFKFPKWIIRKIERIKRGFLWMKPSAAPWSRPHSLVN